MSKIVIAVNAMISNPSKITCATPYIADPERVIFFLYDGKYKWAVIGGPESQQFWLHYYPVKESIEELSAVEALKDLPRITYSTASIKTREASESFGELYQLVKNKAYGMDKVLDDIIGDDTPF